MKNLTNQVDYDVVIVGGGPAGMSASLYIKRAGLRVVIIEKQGLGGKINLTDEVENYLVGEKLKGYELAERFSKQIKAMDIEVMFSEINSIVKENDLVILKLKNGKKIKSKAVIIATGTKERKLETQNSEKFQYKGITYCGVCDGPGYAGKKMVVIGGGNAAVEEGLFLANLASKLVLVHRRKEFRASDKIVEKLRTKNNVIFLLDSVVEEVYGKEKLNKVKIKNLLTNEVKTIQTDVVFPYIGQIPTTSFLENLKILDKDKFIIVNDKLETSVKGIFAAGDVIKKDLRQIATAVSDGCIAAQNCIKYIQENY